MYAPYLLLNYVTDILGRYAGITELKDGQHGIPIIAQYLFVVGPIQSPRSNPLLLSIHCTHRQNDGVETPDWSHSSFR